MNTAKESNPDHLNNKDLQLNQILFSNSFLYKTTHAAGHDLRSPLFVIRSYANLLQKNQDKDRLKRGFKLMEEATYKMENIISEFVGLIDIYTQPIPNCNFLLLEKLLEHSKLQIINLISEFQPTITSDFTSAPSVFFSENYMVSIMASLIDNAIRHNNGKKDLTIHLTSYINNNGEFVLSIEDNGSGIHTQVNKEQLIEPFYSLTEDPKCVGMGLSKVRAIAQVSNSIFQLESKDQEGTKCQFRIKKHQLDQEESRGRQRD